MDLYIAYYFYLGLNYNEVLAFLTFRHGFEISLSTLKRRLKTMRLYRKKYLTGLHHVLRFIQSQLDQSGQLHGYRWMHLRCIQQRMVRKNRAVRIILRELDPVGVEIRSRRRLRRRKNFNKGPNVFWHVDSYDKLKPDGIAINGAIDGFSRYIIWLKAGRTASNPKVVGGYFINAVEKLCGCPRRIRSDFGTENRHIEQFQIFLRDTPVDDTDYSFENTSFVYGTSQTNQRIESWWSILRKHCSQYWINLFQSLKDEGHFSGTYLDKALIQFAFLDIIQINIILLPNAIYLLVFLYKIPMCSRHLQKVNVKIL